MGHSASKASDVENYKTLKDQSYSWDKALVEKTLNTYANARNVNRVSKVLITNHLDVPLQYVNSGDGSGYFFSDAVDAFGHRGDKDNSYRLHPGHAGGFLHSKKADTACGSVGYVSLRVPVQGRNYIVCLGFATVYSGTNLAGIEIRVEDGCADQEGNITHHGVDPTGKVLDIDALACVCHASSNRKHHTFSESARQFTVTCEFSNEEQAEYHFSFIKKQENTDAAPSAA